MSQSEKNTQKKPGSTSKRRPQIELSMDVEEEQPREQNAEKKPQIAQIEQEEGMNKVGSHSFPLLIKENVQTRLADSQIRPVRLPEQTFPQFSAGRKKIKTEHSVKVQLLSNREASVQSPENKSDFRQKGDSEKQRAELAHQIMFQQDKLLRTEKQDSKFFSKQVFLHQKFSQEKPKISPENLIKEKAEIAMRIYNMILNPPKTINLQDKSLHESILDIVEGRTTKTGPKESASMDSSAASNQYDEESLKPFKEMFKDGIKVDQRFFSQPRIIEAMTGPQGNEKFVFHPTHFITSKMFSYLHNTIGRQRVLTGQYGISKTVSCCLFWYLTKFINDYRFQKGVEVTPEMIRVPKFVYWSIMSSQSIEYEDIRSLVIQQCPEMVKQYNVTDTNLYNWKVTIKKFYSRFFPYQYEFRTLIVMDQINQVAKIGRKYKQELKKEEKGVTDDDKDKIQFFKNSKREIQFFKFQFNGALYLSSMGLENDFYNQVSLTLNRNEKQPAIDNVEYSNQFFEASSLVELVDCFLFEFDQRILKYSPLKEVDSLTRKMIKQKFFKILSQEKQKNFFFTTYDIRRYIVKKSKTRGVTQNLKSESDYVMMAEQKFRKMMENSMDDYKNLLAGHFQKKDEKDGERVYLMMEIYNYLLYENQRRFLKEEQRKKQQMNPDLNTLKSNQDEKVEALIEQIPVSELDLNKQIIENLLDKRLFEFNKGDPNIRSLLPTNLLLKFIEPFTRVYLDSYLRSVVHLIRKNKTGSLEGTILENQLIFCLNHGDTNVSFEIGSRHDQDKSKYDPVMLMINNQSVYRFKSLQKIKKAEENKSQSDNSKDKKKAKKQPEPLRLLPRFLQPIKSMNNSKQFGSVLLPVLKKHIDKKSESIEIQQIDSTSKLIDFVFIQTSPESLGNSALIWLFDLTVDVNDVKKKINEFITTFLQCADKDVTNLSQLAGQDPNKALKTHVKVNYIVLSPLTAINGKGFAQQLNTNFKGSLVFDETDRLNYVEVKALNGSSKCLLHRVGWIDINQNFQLTSQKKQNRDEIEAFKVVYAQVMKRRKERIGNEQKN